MHKEPKEQVYTTYNIEISHKRFKLFSLKITIKIETDLFSVNLRMSYVETFTIYNICLEIDRLLMFPWFCGICISLKRKYII